MSLVGGEEWFSPSGKFSFTAKRALSMYIVILAYISVT